MKAESPTPGHLFPRLLGSHGGDTAGPLVIGHRRHARQRTGRRAGAATGAASPTSGQRPLPGYPRGPCRQPRGPCPRLPIHRRGFQSRLVAGTGPAAQGSRSIRGHHLGGTGAARVVGVPGRPRSGASRTGGVPGPAYHLGRGHPVRGHRRHAAESPFRLPSPGPGGAGPGRAAGEHHPEPSRGTGARCRGFRGRTERLARGGGHPHGGDPGGPGHRGVHPDAGPAAARRRP